MNNWVVVTMALYLYYLCHVYIYIYTWCVYIYTIYVYIYYICYSPLKDFWSSCRRLTWVGFEPTTTEFHSGALTNWAIRPRVQLAHSANFVQLLQLHLFFQCSHFILSIAFVSLHNCFKQNRAQVIMLAVEWIEAYGTHHWRIFDVATESWPE